MKKINAIVPIKDNSQRIPGKNFKEFHGKPLMYWILNLLNESEMINKIIVNTDSKRAENIIKEYFERQIEVIKRPDYLCGDKVSINKIIDYTINLDNYKNVNYFIQTHCTNPLLTKETLNKAIITFFNKQKLNYDSLVAVNRIQQRCYDSKKEPINFEIGNLKRTQDLEPIYEINGNIYIFSRETFKRNDSCRIGGKSYLFEMDKMNSLDIDYEEEFKLAELIFEMRKQKYK